MQEIEKLKELLNIKKQNINTKEDEEKINIIEELLSDDAIFFKLKYETAIGILKFLDMNDSEITEIYKKLISPENFQKNVPTPRINLM